MQVSERDSHLCVDIDECIQWNLCPQSCKNLKGSYDCECAQGYTKTANNECVADGKTFYRVVQGREKKGYQKETNTKVQNSFRFIGDSDTLKISS